MATAVARGVLNAGQMVDVWRMDSLYRVRGDGEGEQATGEEMPLTRREWLDGLMQEREALILRLRQIERPLVAAGRLKGESLPRRIR